MRALHSCPFPDWLPGTTSTSRKAWRHPAATYPSASLLPAAHLHSLEIKICATTDATEVLAHPNILVPTTALGGWAELWTGNPDQWAPTFKWSWIPHCCSFPGDTKGRTRAKGQQGPIKCLCSSSPGPGDGEDTAMEGSHRQLGRWIDTPEYHSQLGLLRLHVYKNLRCLQDIFHKTKPNKTQNSNKNRNQNQLP